jgi:hypothetical protein
MNPAIGYYFEMGVDELRIFFTDWAKLQAHLEETGYNWQEILDVLEKDGTYMDPDNEIYIAEVHDTI